MMAEIHGAVWVYRRLESSAVGGEALATERAAAGGSLAAWRGSGGRGEAEDWQGWALARGSKGRLAKRRQGGSGERWEEAEAPGGGQGGAGNRPASTSRGLPAYRNASSAVTISA